MIGDGDDEIWRFSALCVSKIASPDPNARIFLIRAFNFIWASAARGSIRRCSLVEWYRPQNCLKLHNCTTLHTARDIMDSYLSIAAWINWWEAIALCDNYDTIDTLGACWKTYQIHYGYTHSDACVLEINNDFLVETTFTSVIMWNMLMRHSFVLFYSFWCPKY